MTTVFRIRAIACAISSALLLSACGGGSDGSIFNGNRGTSSVFNPVSSETTTTTDTTTETVVIPNQDSDAYTTFAPLDSSSLVETTNESVPKEYYSSKTRHSLHDDLKAAYGDRFETTFRYTTKLTQDGKDVTATVRNNAIIDLDSLDKGHQVYTMNETEETHIDGVKYTGDRTSRIQLYQQANSVVLGRQTLSGELSDGTSTIALAPTSLRIDQIKGTPFNRVSGTALTEAQEKVNTAYTAYQSADSSDKATALAEYQAAQNELAALQRQSRMFTEGLEFNYKGEAFNANSTNANKGTLDYHINFNTRTGHGKITGLDTGTINLNNAEMGVVTHKNPDENLVNLSTGEAIATDLSTLGIQGVANFADGRTDGIYTLGIFGAEATEVAGVVTENNVNTVGFGGVKVSETQP